MFAKSSQMSSSASISENPFLSLFSNRSWNSESWGRKLIFLLDNVTSLLKTKSIKSWYCDSSYDLYLSIYYGTYIFTEVLSSLFHSTENYCGFFLSVVY